MPTINPQLPNDGEDIDAADVNIPFQAILSVLNGNIDEDNIKDGAILLNKLASAVQQALVPTGLISAYGGTTAPSGYLLCDGSAVSRSTYSALFAVLGTAYGVGNGSTTFNLPDLRGRIPVGNDAMGGSAANRIQRSTTITTTSGSPTATVGSATDLSVGMYVESTNVNDGTTITAISGTTITLSANASGSGTGTAARFSLYHDAQELGQAGGADVHKLITAQLAAHGHSLPNGGTGNSANNPGQYLNAQWTNGTAGATGNSGGTGQAGGDQAHPNVQPGQIVNYIVKT